MCQNLGWLFCLELSQLGRLKHVYHVVLKRGCRTRFSRTKCQWDDTRVGLAERAQRTKPIKKLAHYKFALCSAIWQNPFITDFMLGIESKNDSSPNYELNPPTRFAFLSKNKCNKTTWNKIKALCFDLQRYTKENEGQGCELPHQDMLPTGKIGEKQGTWDLRHQASGIWVCHKG